MAEVEPEKQTMGQVRSWDGGGVLHWKGFRIHRIVWLCNRVGYVNDTKGNREAVRGYSFSIGTAILCGRVHFPMAAAAARL